MESTINQDMETESSLNNIPLILTSSYFTRINKRINTNHQRLSNGVIASCVMCNKKIAGSKRVTSNFLQHYKNKHPEMYQRYLKEKGKSQGTNRKSKIQYNFDDKILNFVIRTYSPLYIVDHPAFLSLFEGTQRVVKSRRFITELLDGKYNQIVLEIKNNLSKIDYICCTAYTWIVSDHSYFVYACHWIDTNFKRNSCLLGCRRVEMDRPFANIADVMHNINTRYSISDKQLVCTITGNSYNFAKALNEFGIKCSDTRSGYEGMNSKSDGMNTTFDSLLLQSLTRHMRYATHSLNELATTDYLNALRKIVFSYEKHQQTIKKCSEIWDVCQSSQTAKVLKKICSSSLKVPTVTGWNSLYDAIEHLLSFSDKLDEITQIIGLERFSFSEIEYLQEYCFFMKPIIECLDFLQKDDIYLGYLMPTLLTLKAAIAKFCVSPYSKYLKEIANDMQENLIKRFREFFEFQPQCHDIVIAAITCPSVKILKCTKLLKIWEQGSPNCNVSHLIDIFIKSVTEHGFFAGKLSKKRKSSQPLQPFIFLESSEEDDLQDPIDQEGNFERSRIVEELNRFTENDSNCFSTLNDYPIVKHIFFRYNTPLPSSAPVKRIVSFEDIERYNHWQNLSDDHFEKIVVMNAN